MNIAASTYIWAIERSGKSTFDFCAGFPLAQKWIDGVAEPTIKQLQEFARKLCVPFAYLLMPQPPKEEMPFALFRAQNATREFKRDVYDIIKSLKYRQLWLAEYLAVADTPHFELSGIVDLQMTAREAAEKIRTAIGLEEGFALAQNSVGEAINELTAAAENAGVFVSFSGVVGNNTRRTISVDDCRGFALAHPVAPYIFINSTDAKCAQFFSLAHELAHVMIGNTAGHSGYDVGGNTAEERFCDTLAAELLVPERLLRQMWRGDINQCATKFRVSGIVVARRAHDLGIISSSEYKRYFDLRPVAVPKAKGGGGDFYLTSFKRVGRAFARHVDYAVSSGKLSHVEAHRLTGLWGKTYDNFMCRL